MNSKEIFHQYNIDISEKQEQQLEIYYQLLIEWNNKVNLTAITDYEDVVVKHFVDSALVTQCDEFITHCNSKVLDLGTGAGFPGMVLAILCPNKTFTLIDSLQKRIDFLNIVIDKLQLDHVTTYHGRAEDYGKNLDFRNQFDFVVSRAVAGLPLLLEYCIPFTKKDGYFISYKSIKYIDEVKNAANAFDKLKCSVETVKEFLINQSEKRFLLFIKNNELTDNRYPRKAGKPKKSPL